MIKFNFKSIKENLKRNWKLKLIALLLAVLFWYYVTSISTEVML
ncbi:hypothetical protein [Candidatus Ruminimicrobium bovinum]